MPKGRRGYFKVPDSVLREDWTDSQLATLIRLQAWLNQRWARDGLTQDEAARAFLNQRDLMLITRRTDVRRARAVQLSAVSCVTMETRWTRAGVHIHWPKFAEFQYTDRASSPQAPGKSRGEEGLRVPRPASFPLPPRNPREDRPRERPRYAQRGGSEETEYHRPVAHRTRDFKTIQDAPAILNGSAATDQGKATCRKQVQEAWGHLMQDYALGHLTQPEITQYLALPRDLLA